MVWALGESTAQAHFLFVRIRPPAEAGRFAEVYFSEQAEAGDPRFVDKVAHTRLWLQKAPGAFEPLKVFKASDRLRAAVPAGTVSVAGRCDYGVLPRAVPFLLRHYPKAISGDPAELNRLKPCKEVPFELMATIEGEKIHFVALGGGKPMPGVVFHTVDSDLFNEKLTADAEGRATWKVPYPGTFSVYTSRVRNEAGVYDGRKYQEVREFATLAFTWPLGARGADPEAVKLFEEALASRAVWKDFPGFTADVEGKLDGRPFRGKVTVSADGTVQLKTKQREAESWLRDQLESIILHRAARGTGDGTPRAKPVLRFADNEEDHPLGRLLVFEGGRFASSYRVRDKQITVVNRQMGKQNMTITVIDNERNVEGNYLPRSYVVQYWDAATGALQRAETVMEKWTRVGKLNLPETHTVTSASGTGLSVRSFTLSNHSLQRSPR
ncbi:MAG: DUF3386 family protein [Planctomycetes bacterium]|nr:DUF3386 family protein [Planctomycetota bacterium]